MKLKGEPRLRARVMSPTQTLYDGPALAVSANNRVGPFDILADHANFFSLLTEGSIIVNTGYQSFTFPIQHGIVKVKNNEVTLFIDIEPAYTAAQNKVTEQPTQPAK
jgi:F-type H+-transporting ATPase subunit epsilon